MNVKLKPEKVKNFYALMATFLFVCDSMLAVWIINATSQIEKIVAGIGFIGLMAFFLIIIKKIVPDDNNSTPKSDRYANEERYKDYIQIVEILLELILNKLKIMSIKKKDLTILQEIENLITLFKQIKKQKPFEAMSHDDFNQILRDVIKYTR